MMREQGVLWPAPAIGPADLMQPGVTTYQVGGRGVNNVFVLVRKGWATVYVRPTYSSYAAAFDSAMPGMSKGREVDHLWPKSRAAADDFLALGRIGKASNGSWNASETAQAMAQKVYNMPKRAPHSYMSNLTDLERGWAVVTCYIRPFRELRQANLTQVEASKIG